MDLVNSRDSLGTRWSFSAAVLSCSDHCLLVEACVGSWLNRNFIAMDYVQFLVILLFRIFQDPGKLSPVNIPNLFCIYRSF